MDKSYTSKTFNYQQDFKTTDFRKHPELYQIGIGEQGVLMVEPYKSEILPYWKFKNPEVALISAKKIYSLFLAYKKQKDFVGMDMARKFLQMGFTRSRRYANHASGKKYVSNPQKKLTKDQELQARKNINPQAIDWATNEKAKSAEIFYKWYEKAKNHKDYLTMKKKHTSLYTP